MDLSQVMVASPCIGMLWMISTSDNTLLPTGPALHLLSIPLVLLIRNATLSSRHYVWQVIVVLVVYSLIDGLLGLAFTWHNRPSDPFSMEDFTSDLKSVFSNE